ncbi:MAG: ATP synthase F1 subunit gamma [Armatimonadetes bacterium]|nr:ATP synthase F1 subunit gamma [Armatimonadota bacterium]
MAGLKDIKLRIRSVRNIQQITRAMKMVAAARIRKAEDQLKAARPYSAKLKEVVVELTSQIDEVLHPLMDTRPLKTVGVLVVTSDKGLCGAYNNNLLKMLWSDLATRWKGVPRKVMVVGSKGYRYLGRRQVPYDHLETNWKPSFELATELSRVLTDWFVSGTVDEVVCYYTQAVSAMVQFPASERILPLTSEEKVGSKFAYEFEPSAEVALNILVPRYLTNILFRILMEAKVSELGARLKAMTNATENADKLANELTLQFYRIRQETITREILEISGGAEALSAS